jgi:hypothetical protein
MKYRQSGNWLNHRTVRLVLEDVGDNPDTPTDETSTDYTIFMTLLETGGKTMEQRVLDEPVKTYPGTIQ